VASAYLAWYRRDFHPDEIDDSALIAHHAPPRRARDLGLTTRGLRTGEACEARGAGRDRARLLGRSRRGANVFESLSVRIDGAIGELRLERPEKLNPLSIGMLEELARAARHFDAERGVKVVVVRGSGTSFSSGADLASFAATPGRTTREVAELGAADGGCDRGDARDHDRGDPGLVRRRGARARVGLRPAARERGGRVSRFRRWTSGFRSRGAAFRASCASSGRREPRSSC
jgi:hypothetical protein